MIYIICTLIVCLTVLIYQCKKRECVHEWETTHEVDIQGSFNLKGLTIGKCFIMKCRKCGDIKKRQVEY